MTNGNQVRVGLVITGFHCDPDRLSAGLNVSPSRIYRDGDTLSPSGRRVRGNVWRLDSQLEETDIVERHVVWLFDRLPSTLDVLRSVTSEWKAQITIAAHVRTVHGPSIALSEATVLQLAKWNASVDIDLYCRESDQDEMANS